jgi:hypothetical protein
MGLNGGGYTFLHPFYLSRLTDAELQNIHTDKSNFLMRMPAIQSPFQAFTFIQQPPANR